MSLSSNSPFYDALEARDPQAREQALMSALSTQVAHAQANASAYGEVLAGVDAQQVNSRSALAALPVTRKADVLARQQALRGTEAFGGYATVGWGSLLRRGPVRRVFQSPGPIYEPEGQASDYWRVARALYAAGLRAGDLVHNSFSYHLTPAGSMMEGGAHALGCSVFPGGVGNTELQLQAISDLRPQAYVGTPSFLKILMDKAAEQGSEAMRTVSKALLSGEAFPAALRDWLAERGVSAYQCYATADIGLIAYETMAREGLVLDEGVILEIVRPGSGEPVPEGEVGEVVVTTLNPDYPLIRFGTGDLSAVLPGACPSGRSNTRIKGWMGRADQSAKVRGMFVHASQVAQIVKQFPEVARARLLIEGEMAQDQMRLQVEVAAPIEGLADRLAQAVRDLTKLRAQIELLAPGSLPNDGRVVEDRRRID
ncbi:phenylacetate--CoA ligase family protein [Paucibacter sp. Y2R2-4]|uniref:phenylacetate--CoA ligase family protein n=1 Tax=Paucibacter sp. Y2R2-4 TaxID=2893553 RepID=UPI0021E4AE57|nr:AMP-binding protein [Paucibacter sp. Y2R2-4]MCV2349396.1 AMP-binding protein [Paucibacter sp. Y2R2-4]